MGAVGFLVPGIRHYWAKQSPPRNHPRRANPITQDLTKLGLHFLPRHVRVLRQLAGSVAGEDLVG